MNTERDDLSLHTAQRGQNTLHTTRTRVSIPRMVAYLISKVSTDGTAICID